MNTIALTRVAGRKHLSDDIQLFRIPARRQKELGQPSSEVMNSSIFFKWTGDTPSRHDPVTRQPRRHRVDLRAGRFDVESINSVTKNLLNLFVVELCSSHMSLKRFGCDVVHHPPLAALQDCHVVCRHTSHYLRASCRPCTWYDMAAGILMQADVSECLIGVHRGQWIVAVSMPADVTRIGT